MEDKYTLRIFNNGEILLTNDIGQQFVLSDNLMQTIWQHYDILRVKKKLLSDPVVLENPDNLSAIDDLTEYYLEKRNQMLDVMHQPVFLSYAFSELDADEWDAERSRYEAMLDYYNATEED
ncbi:hypothetical protein AALA24_09850 [Anaerovoracaceae bacterium 42-11]